MRDAQVLLKHLDAPVRILSFSIGDLIAYATPIFVGSLFDSLILIPVGGITLVLLVKRGLKKFPPFYAVRFLYWSLPTKRFNQVLKVNLPASNKHLWVK